MSRRRCRILHRWRDAGMYGFTPMSRCTKCGWWRRYIGYAFALHPPETFEEAP